MTRKLLSIIHHPRFRFPPSSRSMSISSVPPAVKQNGVSHKGTQNGDRSSLIPYSSRMLTGRAMSLDVWTIYNPAFLPSDCINLGQGFMNFPPPRWVAEAANEALKTTPANHYSPTRGRPRLREAIKAHYEASFGRSLDINSEIIVTSGANEGMYAAFTAFLETGDEVIMFEPFFDQYLPSITFNDGKPVYVPLHPPPAGTAKATANDWTIDLGELRRAVTPRTKMIIVNTPHNPVGKVFTRQELEGIAAIAEEFNLLVLSDEVYDILVYPGSEHIRFSTLPGMWDRTLTVLSAGKAFAATGWRVGWLIGPPSLINPTLAATTRIVFCTNSPLQEAVAGGLEQVKDRNFFPIQNAEYLERRDTFCSALEKTGLPYILPQGSYFILLDISSVQFPKDYPFPKSLEGRGRDFKVCWYIAMELGVSSIPVSEFYCDEHLNENYARFGFCKDVETLKIAGERLQGLKRLTSLPSA